MKILANRPFITLRSGFFKKGMEIAPNHPEYERIKKSALAEESKGKENPLWLIVREDKKVHLASEPVVEEKNDSPKLEVELQEVAPALEVEESSEEEPEKTKKRGKKTE